MLLALRSWRGLRRSHCGGNEPGPISEHHECWSAVCDVDVPMDMDEQKVPF